MVHHSFSDVAVFQQGQRSEGANGHCWVDLMLKWFHRVCATTHCVTQFGIVIFIILIVLKNVLIDPYEPPQHAERFSGFT